MSAEWIPCSSGFIEADVIRWTEGVWRQPRRRRGRAVNVGDRVVTAEVLRDEDGFLDLLIRGCAITGERPGYTVSALATDLEIRRKRHTVEKGMVLLDENLDAFEIHEADRERVIAALTAPGSQARNERGALGVNKFRGIGRLVWRRQPPSTTTE